MENLLFLGVPILKHIRVFKIFPCDQMGNGDIYCPTCGALVIYSIANFVVK